MFKHIKTKIKHRRLLHEALQSNEEITQQFEDTSQRLRLSMALPQFEVLVEYLEAQIESCRDALELDYDSKHSVRLRERIRAYRDLIALFNDGKEQMDIEDSFQPES